jgi:hypothetical protein
VLPTRASLSGVDGTRILTRGGHAEINIHPPLPSGLRSTEAR